VAARKGRGTRSRGKFSKACDVAREVGARVRPLSLGDVRRAVRDEISTLRNTGCREGEDVDEDARNMIKEFLRRADRIHPCAT